MSELSEQLEEAKDRLRTIPELHQLDFFVSDYTNGMTPPDLLPLMNTGGDGIHFGVLSDFGLVRSLDEAFVVCVSGTNDPPLHVVARNLSDFLSMTGAVGWIEALDDLDADDQRHRSFVREVREEWLCEREDRRAHKATVRQLRAQFGIRPCRDVVASVREARFERSRRIAVPTLLGPGVVACDRWPVPAERDALRYDFDAPEAKRVSTIESFLERCEPLERLALVRDAQVACIFDFDYDARIARLCAAVLDDLGRPEEAARLSALAEPTAG